MKQIILRCAHLFCRQNSINGRYTTKYQSFRFVPSIPCVKCICITFAITNNILSQIYQITIIWNNLSSIISNNQAQKSSRSCHSLPHQNQPCKPYVNPIKPICKSVCLKAHKCSCKLNPRKRFVLQSHPLIFCITFCISIGLIFFPLNPQYTFRSVPHKGSCAF